MAATSENGKRYERYLNVVSAARGQDEFLLDDVKAACSEEQPAFVTRIVRQLEQDGLLDRCGLKTKPSFRWTKARAQFSPAQWIDRKIYSDQITNAPLDERPRERLLAHGAAALRTAELLAVLVRSGTSGESALQSGEKVAARYKDRLEQLPDAGRAELHSISAAVGQAAYCQILAGIELGRRVLEAAEARAHRVDKIGGTADAIDFCRRTFARLAGDAAQEEFHVVTLDTKNKVLATHQVSVGLLDQSMAHPREVFRPAIRDAAKSVILVHNHPSGDSTPSQQDRRITQRLEQAGETLGIQVLDHIVVARDGATSLRECGAMGGS